LSAVQEIRAAIEEQLKMGEEGLAEEERCLLEIHFETLYTISREVQAYWPLVVQTTWVANRLQRENGQQTGKIAGR
jgi:hypothetical protein